MCKARRQRSIWARIKLSSWKFMILSELHRIQTIELKAHFLFHFALQFSMNCPRQLPPREPLRSTCMVSTISWLQKTQGSLWNSERLPALLHFTPTSFNEGFRHLKSIPTFRLWKPCCSKTVFESKSFFSISEVRLCTILIRLSRTFFIFFKIFSKSLFRHPNNEVH